MRRLALIWFVLVGSLAAGCGGDEEPTRTVVRTVVETVTAPPAEDPASSDAAPADPATESPAGEPLPSGVIAADGTYAMKVRRSDWEGENTTVDDQFGGDRWSFRTECAGTDCTIQMRRELGSGGFKSLSLRPSDRPNVFEAESKGSTNCATNKKAPTKQRYSVKLSGPIDVGGRQTARTVDAFFTETTNGCTVKPARGIVSWRGRLDG